MNNSHHKQFASWTFRIMNNSQPEHFDICTLHHTNISLNFIEAEVSNLDPILLYNGRWCNSLFFVSYLSLPYFLSLPGGCQDNEKEIELGRIDRIAWSLKLRNSKIRSCFTYIFQNLFAEFHMTSEQLILFQIQYVLCMHETAIGSCYFRITFEIRALLTNN